MTEVGASPLATDAAGGYRELFATVVDGGYCIGCGNCAAASGGALRMLMDSEGFVQPQPQGQATVLDSPLTAVTALCPFSNASLDETALAAEQPWGATSHDVSVGKFADLYAGHVADEQFRFAGGSGGMTSWFLKALLDADEIDHVFHVKPIDPDADSEGRIFRYAISSDTPGLLEGRKSRYYPVDLSDVYAMIMAKPGRYAIVAVPCFAKALRLMQRSSPEIAERVRFVVGLVCGHLKSRSFGEFLGWQQGVKPADLRSIDFRVKRPGGDASEYAVEAYDGRSRHRGQALKEYFGTTWDLGFMKYEACEFCDDVFAETADVVFGDAWIQPFQKDWLGSNVVLTRHPKASQLIAEGIGRGDLVLEPISLEEMIRSQASGLRHRREGLAYRLELTDRAGRWRPQKRFEAPASQLSPQRQRVYELRMRIARVSSLAFAKSRASRTLAMFYALVSVDVFRYYIVAFGLKRALTQSVPGKWLRRRLHR